jgi:osmotically-inducible protein OsmY
MGMRDLFRNRERDPGRRDWRNEQRFEQRFGRQQDFGRGERDYEGGRGYSEPYGQEGRRDWSRYADEESDESRRYGEAGQENDEYESPYARVYERGSNYPGGSYGGESMRGGSQYGQYGYGSSRAIQKGTESQQFRGRGPRGYQRSDERIREDVCDCLTEDPSVDATDVEVDVKSGEVTLTGTVGSREQKRRAADVIEDLPGVKDVQNNLRVSTEQRTGTQTTSQQLTSRH